MIPRTVLQGVVSLVFLSGVCCVRAEDKPASELIVGGPCTYRQYKGRGHITAIKKKDTNGDSYEVRFQFHPNDSIPEPFARLEGKDLLLHTKQHKSPKKHFLDKNGIEVGKEFDSVLHVIEKGTCTPMTIEFPTMAE